MANRRSYQFTFSSEPLPMHIWAQITFGAAGAPTLNFGNSYITSVTRNSAGDYTIALKDKWNRLLGVSAVFNSGSSAPAAPLVNVKANNVTSTGLEIVFRSDASVATDPASGEIVFLDIAVKNSSVSY